MMPLGGREVRRNEMVGARVPRDRNGGRRRARLVGRRDLPNRKRGSQLERKNGALQNSR